MTDKEALAQDWKAIGGDISVALGLQKPKIYKVDNFNVFLDGIATLNPFGSMFNNMCKGRQK